MRRLIARRPAIVPIAAALLMLGLALGGVAGADGSSFQVQSVDARGAELGIDVVNTGPAKAKDLEVTVNGRSAGAKVQTFAEAGRASNVVVVVDNSAGVGNGAVQITKEQLKQLAPGAHDILNLGVVSIGRQARLSVPLTPSVESVAAASRSIQPMGEPALWDGIAMAAEELSDAGTSTVNDQIVVVTGSKDAVSRKSYAGVVEALRRSGAALHVITLAGGRAETGLLQSLVDVAGGTMQSGSSNDLGTMLGGIAGRLGHQFRVTVAAPATTSDDLVSLDLDWSGATVSAAYQPGELTLGAAALHPLGDDQSLMDRLAGSTAAKWLIVVMGTLSAGMLVYSVAMLITRRQDGLDFALRHYDGYSHDEAVDDFDDMSISIAGNNEFIRKAVAVTGSLAQRQGFLAKIEDLLERADLPLRPAEALFFYAAGVTIAAIAAAVLSGDFLVLVMVVLIAMLAPNFVVKFRAKRRGKKFVAQLPDMLQLLAGTLRAGYSIAQGFEAVSHEIDDPMGRELRRVMAEARLGRPIEEALDAAAARTKSDDFAWAVMAIRIQREVGGNLAELLLTVSDTMTQRERLRRDVAGLTAEGRMSAMVLGLLPPGLAAVMWVMNPEYIGRLTSDTIGLILLGVAAVAMLAGFAWMKKIINIEI